MCAEKEASVEIALRRSTGLTPFSFKRKINSGDWMVGTDRRAVRLDVGGWWATLADDPAGRPYLWLFCVLVRETG
jgi:hypothetical protein